MVIRKLALKNYRNIEETEFFPCEEVNIVYGENAQGKTNIIEAVWLFTGCKSFRGAKDKELVRFGEEKSELSLDYFTAGASASAALEITNRRKAFSGGVPLASPVGLMGEFTAVVFSPAHLGLVKNGPAERRKFLDTAICQIKPSYTAALRDYARALEQRNSLLKDIPYHGELLDTLDVWDERLVQAGDKITEERVKYALLLEESAKTVYQGLSDGKETFDVRYESTEDNHFGEMLRRQRKNDILAGSTSVGPHRDDIDIRINGVSARAFGSQGQQRSAALALKMAEGEIVKNVTGEYPVLLLDDVMSELDASRQNYVLNHIRDRQVFITCCDPDALERAGTGKKFRIKNGSIV
ncbi:MAG: DNA replication/repair protein RecF [Clostridia bacterium]|nr:DNA replication/repair protein RecF [Clostridia bacterium]